MIGPDETFDVFHSYVDPAMPISDGAFHVHGISSAMLAGQPTFGQVADDFVKFLTRRPTWIVAHSAAFDIDKISRELERAGHAFKIPRDRVICTLRMAASRLGRRDLDAVCDALKIDISARKKHSATLDARFCADVFRQLVFGHDVNGSSLSPRVAAE